MNEDQDYVEFFMESCIDKGIQSPKDICDKALSRMNEIRTELEKENKLRIELRNLSKVLRHFGVQDTKRKRRKRSVISTASIIADMDPSYIDLIVDICDFIDKSPQDTMTPRKIMNNVGSLEDNSDVYLAIKWLCDNGVLTRAEDRSLLPGEKWAERPTEKKKEAV
jgi:hypothetical protein